MVVWVPDEAGTVTSTMVKGTGFGVWALDVSETLEVLAGLTNVDEVPISPLPPANNSPHHSGKCFTYRSIDA
jgi:hypothetical protein